MAEYINTDTVDAITSAVESADMGIAFLIENGYCVVFDNSIVNTGEEAFEDWFFHNPGGEPTMDNLPEEYEGGVLGLIPYNPREIAD